MSDIFIDVTVLEPRMKHPTIFDAFDTITAGQSVVIHNDHDPKPLYYQLLGERGNCFSWTYLANGPEIWKVVIKKNEEDMPTVGEIAAKDMRKAEKMKQLGIDFCCGGKKSLKEACEEKGLELDQVQAALEEASRKSTSAPQFDFTSWEPAFLADYIVNVHHGYIRQHTPVLMELSEKVTGHHGSSFPFLAETHDHLHALLSELDTHMKKEEQILFPYIRMLSQGVPANGGFQSVKEPVDVMEHEHEHAGMHAAAIRRLTNDFTPPAGACNSFRLLYAKMEDFENDLHQHIHLENNILFPKAISMEQKVS